MDCKEADPRPRSSSHVTRVLIAMGVFFTSFLAFMIWWVEFSWIGSFEEHAVSFRGTESAPDIRSILNTENKPVMVHFVDPACECNRFSKEHIDHLTIILGNNVQTLTVRTDKTNRPENASELSRQLAQQLAEWPPATPATAIWDAEGNLAYFGPYSTGAICGRGEDMVLYTLKELVKGNNPRWLNQEAVGCYCPLS